MAVAAKLFFFKVDRKTIKIETSLDSLRCLFLTRNEEAPRISATRGITLDFRAAGSISLYRKEDSSRKGAERDISFYLPFYTEFSSEGPTQPRRAGSRPWPPDARHTRARLNAPFIQRKPLHSRKLIECERPRSTIH